VTRGWYEALGKRALDVAVASSTLLAFSPLAVAVAAAIRLETGSPVLYRQERVGRGGRSFRLWKFRSMVVGAERKGAGILVERGDARITRVGRVLRRLGLDELPQLVNVLKGDMSLVGPRPTLRYQVELYDERERRRLEVRPGITGWAQVHGRKGLDWGRRIELDLEYLDRVTLVNDLAILLRTPLVLLEGEGEPGNDYWVERARRRERAAQGGSHPSLSGGDLAPRW
jgi:lipopolysaccharide/colanic/teichoic acid biosynthesis glycosyltransferase